MGSVVNEKVEEMKDSKREVISIRKEVMGFVHAVLEKKNVSV